MENQIPLTVAIMSYDRVQPIYMNEVNADGIQLNLLDINAHNIFWRMLDDGEFDACEMSMSYYLISKDRGTHDLIAIPIFPSRVFRHSNIYINTQSGIERPEDLKGKRVGVPEYQMTANLWIRGILEDEYGVHPSDITWFRGGEKNVGKGDKLPLHNPNVEIYDIEPGKTLNGMLESGEIDAIFTPRAPESLFLNNSKVKRLFENFKKDEQHFYKKTGIFPIMHTFVIKRQILQEHPWIAKSLYDAFSKSKDICLNELENSAAPKVMDPWIREKISEVKNVMGNDYWPYGIEKNRNTLEKLVNYSYQQGLISRKYSLDELFYPIDK